MVLGVPKRLVVPISFELQPSRNAGHNKWSNIKHIKGARDAMLAKITSKYLNKIRSAINGMGGNNDPEKNPSLAKVIQLALSEGVTKSSIEKGLKSSTAGVMYEDIREIRGPGNCFILVEVLTKSKGQADSEIFRITKKRGGVPEKGLINIFDQRGQIFAKAPSPIDQDKAEEVAIDVGAEEVEVGEDSIIEFLCHPNDFSSVKGKLEEMTYEILDSGVRYISDQMVELETEREQKSFNGLIEALEASEFTTAIHHNVAL